MKPPTLPTGRPLRAGDNVRLDTAKGSAWAHVVDVLSPDRLIVDPVQNGAGRLFVRGTVSRLPGFDYVIAVTSQRATT